MYRCPTCLVPSNLRNRQLGVCFGDSLIFFLKKKEKVDSLLRVPSASNNVGEITEWQIACQDNQLSRAASTSWVINRQRSSKEVRPGDSPDRETLGWAPWQWKACFKTEKKHPSLFCKNLGKTIRASCCMGLGSSRWIGKDHCPGMERGLKLKWTCRLHRSAVQMINNRGGWSHLHHTMWEAWGGISRRYMSFPEHILKTPSLGLGFWPDPRVR